MDYSNYMSPWIFTTTRCNLACPYCYITQDGRDMDDKTYEKVNEVFLNMLESGEKDCIIYRLAGGEPLLMFNNWRPHIDDFLSKAGKKGFVSILTNAAYLTDEMIEYFKDKPIGFGISLDGFSYSKPFHNGESSAEIVKENIDKLLKVTKDIEISTVIDKNSFGDMEKLAEWIAERDLSWGVNIDHFFCGEMDINEIIAKMLDVIDILDKFNTKYFKVLTDHFNMGQLQDANHLYYGTDMWSFAEPTPNVIATVIEQPDGAKLHIDAANVPKINDLP